MSLILTVYLVLALLVSFKDIKYAVALFIPYVVLVPFEVTKIPSNYIGISILLIYYFLPKYKHCKRDWTPVIPFVLFYVLHILLVPFQEGVKPGIALQVIRSSAINIVILPFLIWNSVLTDRGNLKLYRNILLVCIAIAIVYGLLLTQTIGFNPYTMYFYDISGNTFDLERYSDAVDTGRIFGRISSVFSHPMTFGLFLGFSYLYMIKCRVEMNFFVWVAFVLVIILDMLFCGVRSVLLAGLIATVYYLFIGRKIKLMWITAILGIIGYNLLLKVPELADYVASIADYNSKNAAVKGSSLEMRLEQFNGCFSIIHDCMLVGKGYSWSNIYMAQNGAHAVLLSFESLIFVILCNSGLFGLCIWGYFVYDMLKRNKRLCGKKAVIVNSCIVFYLAYSCIIGEYGYMKMFSLFYILMLAQTVFQENKSTVLNKRIQWAGI